MIEDLENIKPIRVANDWVYLVFHLSVVFFFEKGLYYIVVVIWEVE